jgi:hypothetical protein
MERGRRLDGRAIGVRRGWVAFLAVAALAPPGAHADIIAAVDAPTGTSFGCPAQWDVALIDAATGARTALPAGVNTSTDELHPSITSLGTRLTLARIDPAGGTTQVVAVNLGTGQQASLFNIFDAAQLQPSTPTLSPDGNTVITGAPFAPGSNSQFNPIEGLASLANFPGGPFPHSTRTIGAAFVSQGTTQDPVDRADGVRAMGIATGTGSAAAGDILVDTGNGVIKLGSDTGGMAYPALSDPTTNVVVFQHVATISGSTKTVLAFRPVGTFDSAASVNLPAAVNPNGNDVIHPAFTPDGRYLGFIQVAHDGDFHARLFVLDTQTELLVNNAGIDLGDVSSFGCKSTRLWTESGGLSLRETFTLLASSINFSGSSGLVAFRLLQSSAVGILVQRIVGHHRLFGHIVPTLRVIGRVPFGQFKRGSHRVRWNLRVGGRRLARGTYLVTPRLIARNGIVSELGKPRRVQIR